MNGSIRSHNIPSTSNAGAWFCGALLWAFGGFWAEKIVNCEEIKHEFRTLSVPDPRVMNLPETFRSILPQPGGFS